MQKNKKIFQTLSQLGLSDVEVNAYLEIYQIGSMPTSGVARRLKVNRSTIRYTLENLVKKRFLIKSEKNGTFYYVAKDPEDIIKVIKKQRIALKEQETAVSQISGDLKKLKNPNSTLPKMRFFEGIEGLIEMYRDVLKDSEKTNCNIYGYLHFNELEFHPVFRDFVKNEYIPRRIKAKNKSFMIFNTLDSDIEYKKMDEKMNRTTLSVPFDKYPFQTCFHIYNDKIAFYAHLNKQNPSGVIIQQSAIQQDHLSLFKIAWDSARVMPENESYKHIQL